MNEHKYFLGRVDYNGNGQKNCKAYITWELKDGKFSMCAEIWNHIKSDIYQGGQCVDTVAAYFPHNKKAQRMVEVWKRWHLNDLQAGCEHQRALGWGKGEDKIEVVIYGLTQEAHKLRKEAQVVAESAARTGTVAELTETGKALLGSDWFKDKFSPPDADSPLSGCYEVRKREMKSPGWVYPEQHSKGKLCKPCPKCGYKYGSAWLKEELPSEIVKEVESWSFVEGGRPAHEVVA